MINWKTIAGAALDGSEYDLWLHSSLDQGQEKGPGIRIPNCRFMRGAWYSHNEIEDGCTWTLIEGYAPTHYAEITPPQEPLSWPNASDWFWCKVGAMVFIHEVELMPPKPDGSRRAKMSGVEYDEEGMEGVKFIRATPPSFGDAP